MKKVFFVIVILFFCIKSNAITVLNVSYMGNMSNGSLAITTDNPTSNIVAVYSVKVNGGVIPSSTMFAGSSFGAQYFFSTDRQLATVQIFTSSGTASWTGFLYNPIYW